MMRRERQRNLCHQHEHSSTLWLTAKLQKPWENFMLEAITVLIILKIVPVLTTQFLSDCIATIVTGFLLSLAFLFLAFFLFYWLSIEQY